ncbi:MAG: DNA polymerase III subunit delta [Fusicatenibacter sp.]|nr:DNA polymerase III subunit delta [Lachnospiraceae bacterium]MDY2938172.1 DNA polymerase III subunit delta [Fusicatenibacter sp.]
MKSILEDIKNQDYKRAYLFYGDEEYLKNQYKNRLKNALVPEDDTMNFSRFEGKGTDSRQVIDLAETMPFFAERRVILMENTGFFKNKADEMADYLANLPDYLVLLFVEEEVDKRSRMYKALQKCGRAVEFVTQDEKTLMTWILGMLKKEGKKITRPDMELFLEKTGTDMGNIAMELEKLQSYTMGREIITAKDIEAVCTTQITNRIFDMIRAVTEKKQRKALELYYDLLSLKEPPMRILFLLARQFNLLLQVKELLAEQCDQQTIAKRTGLSPFVVKNYIPLSRQYEREELEKAVGDCVQMEEDVKTGKIGDTLSVELLIIRYSGDGSAS